MPQYVAAGMPLTSEAEAEKWRRDNQKKITRKELCVAGTEPIPQLNEEPSHEEISAKEELERAKTASHKAYELMLTQMEGRSFINARAAIAGYHESVKMLATARESYAREQLRTKETLQTSEVQEKLDKTLGVISQLLVALPSSLCARANPSDPECAKQAIEDGVKQIFNQIEKTEGVFK